MFGLKTVVDLLRRFYFFMWRQGVAMEAFHAAFFMFFIGVYLHISSFWFEDLLYCYFHLHLPFLVFDFY